MRWTASRRVRWTASRRMRWTASRRVRWRRVATRWPAVTWSTAAGCSGEGSTSDRIVRRALRSASTRLRRRAPHRSAARPRSIPTAGAPASASMSKARRPARSSCASAAVWSATAAWLAVDHWARRMLALDSDTPARYSPARHVPARCSPAAPSHASVAVSPLLREARPPVRSSSPVSVEAARRHLRRVRVHRREPRRSAAETARRRRFFEWERPPTIRCGHHNHRRTGSPARSPFRSSSNASRDKRNVLGRVWRHNVARSDQRL
jgi:hypothetical protein